VNSHLIQLLQKHKPSGILIDTNLLLLFIVGKVNIERIRDFRRTSQFTTDDFETVNIIVKLFDCKIITTPHILTQVSDLIGRNYEFRLLLKLIVEKFVVQEISTQSKMLINERSFFDFGLADTAIIETAKNPFLVFTDDNPLYGFLLNSKIDAVNLEQFRNL
jgi:rRNA-processing protein FCF1